MADRFYRKDRDEIVNRLRQNGKVLARPWGRGVIRCDAPFLELFYVDRAWRGRHHPGLPCSITTSGDLDKVIRCMRATPDDATLDRIEMLIRVEKRVQDMAFFVGRHTEMAVRVLAGCPRPRDVIAPAYASYLLQATTELLEEFEHLSQEHPVEEDTKVP